MKVKRRVPPAPPAEYVITLSEDEARILKDIGGANQTVADTLTELGYVVSSNSDSIAELLGDLYHELCRKGNI